MHVTDIATDTSGNLIVPDAFSGIDVYAGPGMCGPLLATLTDTYGQASDAAAIDAVNGNTVVANVTGSANVVVCSLAVEACFALTSPNMTTAAGVAMDLNGNCYADGLDTSKNVGLWVYPGCNGTGTEQTSAQGFVEPHYGGLDIDSNGHLVVISVLNSANTTPSTLSVYKNCGPPAPACTLIGGPFQLSPLPPGGKAEFGHLNKLSTRFVTADFQYGQLDIYKYAASPPSLTYLYSFNNHLQRTRTVKGAAYKPASMQ